MKTIWINHLGLEKNGYKKTHKLKQHITFPCDLMTCFPSSRHSGLHLSEAGILFCCPSITTAERAVPGKYLGTHNMYNENTGGFQLNDFLKRTSRQEIAALSCLGCKFLPLRKVKMERNDTAEDGLLVLVPTGTRPERRRICLDF